MTNSMWNCEMQEISQVQVDWTGEGLSHNQLLLLQDHQVDPVILDITQDHTEEDLQDPLDLLISLIMVVPSYPFLLIKPQNLQYLRFSLEQQRMLTTSSQIAEYISKSKQVTSPVKFQK